MLDLDDLMLEVQTILGAYGFIRAVADLDRTDNALRFRLIIDETMFIQVYANSSKRKLNFALVGSGQRIFGRTVKEGGGIRTPSLLRKATSLMVMRENR